MPKHSCILRTYLKTVVVLLTLVFLVLVVGGCSGSGQLIEEVTSSTEAEPTSSTTAEPIAVTVAEVAPELAVFGELAAIEAPPVSTDFDSAGGAIKLADGATVTVASGVFAEDTTLTVTIVGLAVGCQDPRVGLTSAYVIESDRDTASLSEPVILEVPLPSEVGGVATLEDGEWIGVEVPDGDTTKIGIAHFSKNIITVTAASYEILQQMGWLHSRSTGEFLKPGDAERVALEEEHQEWVRTEADQATRDFYGLDENGDYIQPTYTQEEMCEELQGILSEFSDFSLPEGARTYQDAYALFRFLINADTPRNGFEQMGMRFTGFWDLTGASMDEIDQKVRASSTRLTPAQVLKIATDANGGNVSLGLLAAHNYLKDIAYGGRLVADPEPEGSNNNVPPRDGEAARHLEPWRETRPDNPVGRLDKMGSLYHIFAAAVAEVWFDAAGAGEAVSFGEQLMRVGFFTTLSENTQIPFNMVFDDKNDVPDINKGAADLCGARLGGSVLAKRRGEDIPTEDEQTADLDGIKDGVYRGEVYYIGQAQTGAGFFEFPESTVELVVTDEGISATVEFVQRWSAYANDTEATCIATVRMRSVGQGPVTNPLSLTMEPVVQEVVGLEGEDCGSYQETLDQWATSNQTRTLVGMFSNGRFEGTMDNPYGVWAETGD